MTGATDPTSADLPSLVCYRCGRTAAFPDRERCDCGEPLWFDTDDAAAGFHWPDSAPDDVARPDAGPGVWRYASLLPVGPDRNSEAVEGGDESESTGAVEGVGAINGVVAAAGDTPLVRASRLDDYAGCRFWLKDERANPTGSFKDRGSAVGAAWVASTDGEEEEEEEEAADNRWLGTVSHGNMAVSVAANAAGVGAAAVVLVPDDVAPARLAAIAEYDPTVLRVDGDYGALYRETVDADVPVAFVNSDAALRVAGQKTTALEVCEAFAGGEETEQQAPDALVLPVSSGGHASAAWKALRELRQAGLLGDGDVPRLYLVQAAACDPIAQAYRADADEVTAIADPEETVAYSIANPDPPSGTRALTAARETGGGVVSVPDDEILTARARLATDAGFAVEPASATTLAGIRRLSASGELDADDEVVAVLTGRGFGAGGRDAGGSDAETVALADVRERLENLT